MAREWYASPFVTPFSDLILNSTASPEPTPEEILIEQEEGPEAQPLTDLEVLAQSTDLDALIDRIPAREGDILRLYFLHGKRQAEIAEVFHMTQAAISYLLQRSLRRLRWIAGPGSWFTAEDLRRDLTPHLAPLDVEILSRMWSHGCQTDTSKELGITQGRTRHRMMRCVRERIPAVIKKGHPELQRYVDGFEAMIKQRAWTVFKRVELPQWQKSDAPIERYAPEPRGKK